MRRLIVCLALQICLGGLTGCSSDPPPPPELSEEEEAAHEKEVLEAGMEEGAGGHIFKDTENDEGP